jgi:hypothetical protein
MAVWMPSRYDPPFFITRSTKPESLCASACETGRRYARCANAPSVSIAQACSWPGCGIRGMSIFWPSGIFTAGRRPDEFHFVHEDIAISAQLRVGIRQVHVIVQIDDRNLLPALFEDGARFVGRASGFVGDIEDLHLLPVDLERQLRRLGSGEFAVGAHADRIFGLLRDIENGVALPFPIQPEHSIFHGLHGRGAARCLEFIPLDLLGKRLRGAVSTIARCTISSAAARYFSISIGGSESTSPILSKP